MIPCPLCWWLTTKKGMADKQNGWWQQESRIRMERDVFVFLLTHLSYACSHFVDPFWWWRQHLQAPTLLVLCIGWCNHFTICRATRALLVNMQAKENSNYCEFQSLAHVILRSWTTEICTLCRFWWGYCLPRNPGSSLRNYLVFIFLKASAHFGAVIVHTRYAFTK